MQEVQLEKGQLRFNINLCRVGLVLCAASAIGIGAYTQEPLVATILNTVPVTGTVYFAKHMYQADKELKKLK